MSRKFKKVNIERLKTIYMDEFQKLGKTKEEAEKSIDDKIKFAKMIDEDVNFIVNRGKSILQNEGKNEQLAKQLEWARSEGASDNDIIIWYNLSSIERALIIECDNMYRSYLFWDLIVRDRLSKEEAARIVHKTFPLYGNVDSETNMDDDDKPLPFELKDRINRFMPKQKNLKERIDKYSSVNAFIRDEIKKGNL